MDSYSQKLYMWADALKSEERGALILRKALRNIHEECFSPRAKYESSINASTQDLIIALEQESRRPSSLISQARAGSQGTYYNLIKDGYPPMAKPISKAIAILSFLADKYGIKLDFDSDGGLVHDREENYKFTVQPVKKNGDDEIQIDKESTSVWYIAYYWRDDNQIGIASLEFYRPVDRHNLFQRVNMQFYYATSKVSLTGKVECLDPHRQDVTLFIQLKDDEDQEERNEKHNLGAVITSLTISIPDNDKDWSMRKVLFATYTTAHRKIPRYAHSGLMMLVKMKLPELYDVVSKKFVPDYVRRYLFQTRFQAPHVTIDSTKPFEAADERFRKHFEGLFVVYYLSGHYNTLEQAYCKIQANGEVELRTPRNKIHYGQCFLVTDSICHISFGRIQETAFPVAKFTYTIEHDLADGNVYGVYSGVNSHNDIKSGRVFMKRLAVQLVETTQNLDSTDESVQQYNQLDDFKPKPFELDPDNETLYGLILRDRVMYSYLTGSRLEHYSDSNALKRFYQDFDNPRKRFFSFSEIQATYKLYTIEITNRTGELTSFNINATKIVMYPLDIDRYGIARIKGRINQYEDQVKFENDIIRVGFNIPEDHGAMTILIQNSRDKLGMQNGVISRIFNKRFPTVDSRICLVVRANEDFSILNYDESGSWDSLSYTHMDKELEGSLSYLRSSSNRYFTRHVAKPIKAIDKTTRRVNFWASCYLADSDQSQATKQLEQAFNNGFAPFTFIGLPIYSKELDHETDALSFREDWRLLENELKYGKFKEISSIHRLCEQRQKVFSAISVTNRSNQ